MANWQGRLKRIEKELGTGFNGEPEIPQSERVHVFYHTDDKSRQEIDGEIEARKRELIDRYGHCQDAVFMVVEYVNEGPVEGEAEKQGKGLRDEIG